MRAAALVDARAVEYLAARGRLAPFGGALLLLAAGHALLWLACAPGDGFRPLVVMAPVGWFRFSVFGDLFALVACLRLAQAPPPGDWTGLGRASVAAGAVLYALHGLSSVLDPAGLFLTDPLLELAVAVFPPLVAWAWLRPALGRAGLVIAGAALAGVVLAGVLGAYLRLGGLAFAAAGAPVAKLVLWQAVRETGALYRLVLDLAGLAGAALLVLVRLRAARLVPGGETGADAWREATAPPRPRRRTAGRDT